MTEVRKAGRQSTARRVARERATERAAEFRRRENALEELAVDYFVAVATLEDIEAEAARQIVEIRARADDAITKVRRDAAGITGRMLDQGIARSEVATRLGIAVRDVPKTAADE
ncbi:MULTISPECIES: hypothetical protein [Clavibacter]|uniref:Uncharacterized protein n=2 Tax=Clavibacter TaxID=1573 RepID=A0A399NY78_9MICO|nr:MULTISPECIES: hypothetical protein [Clavibacter]KDP89782.1 hypothetical protein W824_14915 [Clavibacter cf. michiganensis LMG 26808]RII99115.1 hypothetical protein DZF96_00315 [Clavibacter michiganensis]UKF26679.1 hypothetical protein KYT88_15795 [Clavibacter sp. A6099]